MPWGGGGATAVPLHTAVPSTAHTVAPHSALFSLTEVGCTPGRRAAQSCSRRCDVENNNNGRTKKATKKTSTASQLLSWMLSAGPQNDALSPSGLSLPRCRFSVSVPVDVSSGHTRSRSHTLALRVVVGFVFVFVSLRCADFFFLLLRCTVESIIFFSALSRTKRPPPRGLVQYDGSVCATA